ICLVNPADSNCVDKPTGAAGGPTEWAWTSHANATPPYGGRNGPVTQGQQARRVLVIMTDGQDEAWPTAARAGWTPGTKDWAFPENAAGPSPNYDDTFQSLATAIKSNPPDAASGGPPVEIYVVGFFCTDSPQSFDPNTSGFCQSKQAYLSPAARTCPGTN